MKVLDLCTGKVDERMQVLDERTKRWIAVRTFWIFNPDKFQIPSLSVFLLFSVCDFRILVREMWTAV